MKSILFAGQGAQFKGMGKDLFHVYPELTRKASDILGYCIETLCTADPENKLKLTQYTQPALYVVNGLGYFYKRDSESASQRKADFLAGHSLGEYNALLAANAFSFETGLQLVKKRGELMAQAAGGAMAAVIGMTAKQVGEILQEHKLEGIDVANFNTPTQCVIAGKATEVASAESIFVRHKARFVMLNVSAAFHSRYMRDAQQQYADFLRGFTLHDPEIPVIANATAEPYVAGAVAGTLAEQLASPVKWTDSIRYLLSRGNTEFIEIGSNILGRMVAEIRSTPFPVRERTEADRTLEGKTPANRIEKTFGVDALGASQNTDTQDPVVGIGDRESVRENGNGYRPRVRPELLGSSVFRERYGLKYAYVAGGMYRSIASAKLVARMGRSGFIGFFGTGGLSLGEIESGLRSVQAELQNGEPYGMNLLANYAVPAWERDTVELFLKYKVRNVEAAAFMQMTPALVLFRLQGLRRTEGGDVACDNRILAKISRPEVAEAFMRPAPAHIVQQLLREGAVTAEQAELAQLVPMSHDICIEADSGGHTDGGIASTLMPAMLHLKNDISMKYQYRQPLCVGLAGGIGTPEAAAAAFVMGADFILTGSINQCTQEAGTSNEVKDLLQDMNVHDTAYAPAGDMFEIGARIQVLRKGVFFPVRANKLYELYSHYNSLDEIPERIQKQIQTNYFKKNFAEVWNETKDYLQKKKLMHEIEKAENNPKHKMALIFRWYFSYTNKLALEGSDEDKVNYQIHTGPALGAFNRWVRGTPIEGWSNRHADDIARMMMNETARYLDSSFSRLVHQA